jgi:hypothetical protein
MQLFRQRIDIGQCAGLMPLPGYTPALPLEGLLAGIDNLRHDVVLSSKFVQAAQAHVGRLVAEYGEVKDLSAEVRDTSRPPSVVTPAARQVPSNGEAHGFKDALLDLLATALTRAKSEGNLSLETLCRLAAVKFLRQEMSAQFLGALDRCRARLQEYETSLRANPQKGVELRERVAQFQVAKRTILRRVGQELFSTLRDLEKTALLAMRRSLFGAAAEPGYELFLNRLLFMEDGPDDFLSAEHYVMLGNRPGDPDSFAALERVALEFFRTLGYEEDAGALLNQPENTHALFLPREDSRDGLHQTLLSAWVDVLQREGALTPIVAAYEAAPLLAEYCPPIHPQELKRALVSREERRRVENLLQQQRRLSPANLRAAARRVLRCRGADREKLALRLLHDFMRLRRDLQRLGILNSALGAVNLIGSEQRRRLSGINRTLYEFLSGSEQQPPEARILHHVILKADIRDSTALTRTLYDRGLNPASYFSLNFYEPVNKLLPKYGAQKLFLEGDALILALFERENEPGVGVGCACGLAKEIIEIVQGYNQLSRKTGLPILELGIGISYQDTAPMYLMDGSSPIMISPALNASDRLSSCSKSARRLCAGVETVFNVFAFQTIDDADAAGQPEEFLVRYNIGGIVLDEAAFQKLQQEISLAVRDLPLPALWGDGVRLHAGSVPVAPGIVHRLAIREGTVPHIDAREFALKNWTDRKYYEVCTNPAVYELLDAQEAGNAKF